MMDFVNANVGELKQLFHKSLIVQQPQIRQGSLTPSRTLSDTRTPCQVRDGNVFRLSPDSLVADKMCGKVKG